MKIPVYMMPGMAADYKIFQYLTLPEEYEVFYLDWKIPTADMSLEAYVQDLLKDIKHENPILIGVSFGGIVVQEMAKLIPVRKVIIISSVKSKDELPLRMKLSKQLGLHHLVPTTIFKDVSKLEPIAINDWAKRKIDLYKNYLTVSDPVYLHWAMHQVVNWQQQEPLPGVIHIQGDADVVFPIKHIKNCIVIEGGTHAMILVKSKWFNENLPALIEN